MYGGIKLRGRQLSYITLIVSCLFFTGCIRPVDENSATPTGEANNVSVNTTTIPPTTNTGGQNSTPVVATFTPTANVPPPTADPNLSPNQQFLGFLNQYYILQTGFQLPLNDSTFVVWERRTFGSDIVAVFNANNSSGLPCVGIAAYTSDASGNPQIYSAGYHCSTDVNAVGIAGQWLIAPSSAPPINAIVIHVNRPDVQNITITYQSGPQESAVLNGNNYFIVRTDLITAAEVIVPDSQGSLIGTLPVALNPQR